MHITTFETFVAFSDTQKSFLVKEKQFSPEGGESLAFRIINCKAGHYRRFEISNTFNPGDGNRAEQIGVKECKATLESMKTYLHDQGFSGIDLCGESCDTEVRERIITITPPVLEINKQGFFAREKDQLVLTPYSIQARGPDLILYKDDTRLLLRTPDNKPDIQQMQAWKTPDNCLMVLFSFFHFNSHHITDILCSSDGISFDCLFLKNMQEE